MKLKYVLRFGLGLTVMLLFVSCQSETDPTIATSPVKLMTTSTMVSQSSLAPTTLSILPTITATEKVKTTSNPVLDPTLSPTVALETETPLPTQATPTYVAVTLTPLPTFAADELEVAVAELLANPMNCVVPCWWGSVPNETMVFEVQQFLALYQFTDYKHDVNQIPDYIDVGIGFDKNENRFDFRVRYSFENNVLKIVFSEQSPSLYEILKRYGEPDEVWLATGITPAPMPVRLNLVYLQESMAFGYVTDGDAQSGMFRGCFADETGNVRLNLPNSATNYKEFRPIFELDRRYLPLEEATGLTMNDFMQQFSDPNQPQCIETPIELWE